MKTRSLIYSHSDKSFAYFDVIFDGIKSVEKISLKSKVKLVNIKGVWVQSTDLIK